MPVTIYEQVAKSFLLSDEARRVLKETRRIADAVEDQAALKGNLRFIKRRGITQAELAKLLNTSQRTLSRWKHGVHQARSIYPLLAVAELVRLIKEKEVKARQSRRQGVPIRVVNTNS